MKPALVLLAAGASRRLGRCKATADIGGATPLARLAAAAAQHCDGAWVVTGAHDAEIRSALPEGVEVLFNASWEAGRTGGVALAAAALEGRDAWLAPVDVPLVPAETFGALLDAWQRHGAPAEGWLAPRHLGRFGHPVLVGRDLLARARHLAPDEPLRALRDAARPLLHEPVDEPAVLDDLDDPADLESLIERVRRR